MVTLLSYVYRRLIRLYPPSYQVEYDEELLEVFDLSLQEASDQGFLSVLAVILRELRDLPGVLLSVHLRMRKPAMINLYFPHTSDRTPWRIAVLSLVPFLFTGPLAVIVGYHPSWGTQQFPSLTSVFLIVTAVLLCLGFFLGVLHKFPRWSYLYMGYSTILLIVLTGNWVNRMHWDFPYAGLLPFFIGGLVILITRLLPVFRPFYAHIRQDWTLLSYCLYAFTLLILSVQDHDETPRLTLVVLLPSLIGLLGALAHLRLASPIQRVLALLLSMLLAALFFSIPLFNSMSGSVDGFLLALSVLLILWIALAALIIAPMLIGVLTRQDKSSTA